MQIFDVLPQTQPLDDDIIPLNAKGGEYVIAEFILPLFDDADTSFFSTPATINAPLGWGHEFMPFVANLTRWNYQPDFDPFAQTYGVDPNALVRPNWVLRYYTDTPLFDGIITNGVGSNHVYPGQTLGGFSFVSAFSPGQGPVQLGFDDAGFIFDPDLPATPNSPFAVPEPLTALLSLVTLGVLWMSVQRRRVAS